MATHQAETTRIPEVGEPDYWLELSQSLTRAKDLLWARVQRGFYYDDEEAKATMEAYWAVKKVIRQQERTMRQPPLLLEEQG